METVSMEGLKFEKFVGDLVANGKGELSLSWKGHLDKLGWKYVGPMQLF